MDEPVIDYSQYICEKCGTQGVCEDGMDVFIALLCQDCFDREWAGYVAVLERDRAFLEAKARVKKRIDEAIKEKKDMAYNATLHDALIALPIYGDHECAGIDGQCTHPACIRHPASGKFYCSGHALQLAESHPVELEDISTMVQQRQSMLDEDVECDLCEKPAERMCNVCGTLICFDHYYLIPRTGAACPDCGEAMEQEAEEAGRY